MCIRDRLGMDATQRYENARKTVCRFLNAACPEEIIFTRNTTEALNLVAYSYALSKLRPGDEILVSIMEHHSNLLPWQMAAKRTGAVLKLSLIHIYMCIRDRLSGAIWDG